jgi:hypothetical protein
VNNNQDNFFNFVNGVYYDLGEPEDYSVSRLYAWFLDTANIGKLNNLIGTSLSGICYKDNQDVCTGYAILPEPSSDQFAIYKLLFEYEYLKGYARYAARSALSVRRGDWNRLQEGDTSISRISKTDISKNLSTMAKQAKEELDKATKMYLKYNAIPDQVVGDDTIGVENYIIQEYNRTLN